MDNLNPYYDVSLKKDRLDRLTPMTELSFYTVDLADKRAWKVCFRRTVSMWWSTWPPRPESATPLPSARLCGLEPGRFRQRSRSAAGTTAFKHLVFASSSSVYGANTRMPFSVHHNVDHPVSLYAATKKANELMAHTYSHLYGLPCTGLRFFTVYGPWGRPDMALFLFTEAILEASPSRFSITAKCSGTLPISTISSKGSSG